MANDEEKDCPTQLIKLANTPFERATVTEFIEVEGNMKAEFSKIKSEMKNIKWLLVALFGLLLANFVKVLCP